MSKTLEALGSDEQLAEWESVVTDRRPRVSSGIEPLDDLLNRRSFGPGELVILGGRMHTRKTGLMMNMVYGMLKSGVPVGLVGLDESPAMYVAKLASVLSGVPHTHLNENWDSARMAEIRDEYRDLASLLSIAKGSRPSFPQLSDWLEMADVTAARPRVVFVDYMSLLAREKYTKGDTERIQRLAEDVQVWTNDEEVTTVVLHQVGRANDTAKRYHGDSPMTPEQLMHGGEQAADVILATFRPALNPLGNMTERQAAAEGHDHEEWESARQMVDEYADITMLQVIKNRPGTRLWYSGIPLRSHGESQRMTPAEELELDDEGKLVTDEGA